MEQWSIRLATFETLSLFLYKRRASFLSLEQSRFPLLSLLQGVLRIYPENNIHWTKEIRYRKGSLLAYSQH